MRRLLAILLLTLVTGLPGASRAAAKDELIIGLTQFPSTFHPNIDSMAAKSYVLGMAQRPFTTFDAEWQLICMLCTELPTIENGRAVIEKLDDGSEGIALTYTIQAGATWGDGTPVSTDDVMFTYEVGAHPESGISNAELYRRILAIEVVDRQDLHVACRPRDLRVQRDQRLPRAAGASRAAGVRGGPEGLPHAHALRCRPRQPRALLRPLPDHRGLARRLRRARAQPDLVGREALLPPHRRQGDREHRGARGEPALGRHRHDRGRARPHGRPGAGVRAAPWRGLPDRLPAGAGLRAHRPQPRQPDPRRRPGAQGADHGARPGGALAAAVRGPPGGRRHQRQPARLGPQRGRAALSGGSGGGRGAARGGRLARGRARHAPATPPASRSRSSS